MGRIVGLEIFDDEVLTEPETADVKEITEKEPEPVTEKEPEPVTEPAEVPEEEEEPKKSGKKK